MMEQRERLTALGAALAAQVPGRATPMFAESERLLPFVAAAGIPQMIVFSGNRGGTSDAEGFAGYVAQQFIPVREPMVWRRNAYALCNL